MLANGSEPELSDLENIEINIYDLYFFLTARGSTNAAFEGQRYRTPAKETFLFRSSAAERRVSEWPL